jgi:hypothetical protein
MKERKPGTVREGRIPIYKDDNLVGNVGRTATDVTVSRFTHRPGSKLGRKNGRQAWIAPSASKPTLASSSAAGTTAGAPAPVENSNQKSARGSNPAPK